MSDDFPLILGTEAVGDEEEDSADDGGDSESEGREKLVGGTEDIVCALGRFAASNCPDGPIGDFRGELVDELVDVILAKEGIVGMDDIELLLLFLGRDGGGGSGMDGGPVVDFDPTEGSLDNLEDDGALSKVLYGTVATVCRLSKDDGNRGFAFGLDLDPPFGRSVTEILLSSESSPESRSSLVPRTFSSSLTTETECFLRELLLLLCVEEADSSD